MQINLLLNLFFILYREYFLISSKELNFINGLYILIIFL
jgi:hypothetical protein